MGRYRAAKPPASAYITQAGYDKLCAELNTLWRVKRPAVTKAVAAAAAMGDRSENAEYIYGKKQLREIDSRLCFLRKRLDQLNVISGIPENCRQVFFSAWVKLEDSRGQVDCYRIVGPDEIDLAQKWISMDSPLAQVLLKKSLGDEVELQLPNGFEEYIILQIDYTCNPCSES